MKNSKSICCGKYVVFVQLRANYIFPSFFLFSSSPTILPPPTPVGLGVDFVGTQGPLDVVVGEGKGPVRFDSWDKVAEEEDREVAEEGDREVVESHKRWEDQEGGSGRVGSGSRLADL